MRRRTDGSPSRPPAVPAREISPSLRTHLLHRMLILRHLGSTLWPGWWPPGHPGTEAIVTGIGAALGPADLIRLVRTPPSRDRFVDGSVMITIRLRHGSPDDATSVCALLVPKSRRSAGGSTIHDWDVEAVLTASADAAQTIRAHGGIRLLHVPMAEPADRHDPIAVLADRMRRAGQLDDNAFRAINDHARRVATVLTEEGGLRRPFPALITQAGVHLMPDRNRKPGAPATHPQEGLRP